MWGRNLLKHFFFVLMLGSFSPAHAQDTVILEEPLLKEIFQNHSFKVFLSNNDGSLFVKTLPNKTAFVYHAVPGEKDTHSHSSTWQQGSWSLRGSELCLITDKSVCGDVGAKLVRGRTKNLFWLLDDQIRHEIYDHTKDEENQLSDPKKFFEVRRHLLSGSRVYVWSDFDNSYDSYDKPLDRKSQVLVGEVLGFREKIQYERPAGYLVRILGSASVSTNLLPEGEMELSISEKTNCLQGAKRKVCSTDHIVVTEERIIKTSTLEKLISRVDRQVPAKKKLPTVL